MTDYFGRDAVNIANLKGTRGLPYAGVEPDVSVTTTSDQPDNYYPYDDPDGGGSRHFANVAEHGVLEILVTRYGRGSGGGTSAAHPRLVRRYSAHAWLTVEGASHEANEPVPPITGPVIPDTPLPPLATGIPRPARPVRPTPGFTAN